ncbi:YopX family protein [Enterococcus sp. SMC-9]|uniref:YopX family protein n=1 Tax=Enterococcus sp. SMC-9 TaxID=2862343 RepID=UPI001E5148DC|nr:YopX family protein [Enterococcus sp. SMC-9]MCD1025811.1 hypothetical protein [Enterococcus sp. SMC-9]
MIPKYRAWDKKDKVIREVTAIDWSLEYVEFMNGAVERSFDDLILMQSTGLKDKNGVEIFEGDIVKTFSNINKFTDSFAENVEPNYGYTSIVRDGASFKMTYKGKPSYVLNENAGSMAEHMEVLGSIWENPELLEGAKE